MKSYRVFILVMPLLFLLTSCARQGSTPQCACQDKEVIELKAKDTVFKSLNEKTVLAYQKGQLKEATFYAKQALDYAEKSFGKKSVKVGTALNNLGELFRLQGSLADAEKSYKRSLSIREKILGKEHPEVALSENNLASVYFSQKRFNDAEKTYKKSINSLEKYLKPTDPNLVISKKNLAEVYKVQRRYPDAESVYKQIIVTYENNKVSDIEYAKTLNDLGALYFLQGKYKESLPIFNKTLATLEQKLGKTSADLYTVLDNLSQAYTKSGDKTKAKEFSDRANALKSKKIAKNQ